MKQIKYKIIAVISLILLIGSFFYFNSQKNASTTIQTADSGDSGFSMAPADPGLLMNESSPSLGPDIAPVIIVEFLDPECEACSAMHPIMKRIISEHPGQIRLVIRYMPFHTNSVYAARVLEGAKEQGKFWEALNIMFERQQEWASHHDPQPDLILPIIKSIGLDTAKIAAQIKDGQFTNKVNRDKTDGEKLGVNRTPTFFVNGEQLYEMGYQPLKDLVLKKLQAAQ
jgi:protein-disulfide isomerase